MSTTRPATLTGIVCLSGGLALFGVQDLILKLLSGDYPLHQAMVLRGLTALPLLYLMVRMNGDGARLFAPGWTAAAARGVVSFLAYTSYYLALVALPLADTIALYFSAPLMIVALSVVMLGERVSLPRWIAVLVGFGGVIIMVRPGSAMFDGAALLAVGSGLAYALSMILARIQGGSRSAAVLAFHGNAVFLIGALLLAAVFGGGQFAGDGHPSLQFMTRAWVMPSPTDALLMASCGVIAALGLTLITQAYRIAPSAAVAPFEYTLMIWGVAYGWIFLGDWPDRTAWTGIAVITGAGLFVLLREGQERRNAQIPAE